jgi:opacity protein-like surface antigen
MKRLLIAAASVFLLVGAASSAALAGEVKGPPNQVDNTDVTGALDHANSACAASGLNDFDTTDPGQNVSQVQTAADAWNFYGFAPGATGTLGLCQGGTGEV